MIKVTGGKKLMGNMGEFSQNLNAALDKAVMIVASAVQSEAVDSIKQPSSGKLIKRRSITHIQSIEGQAPNTDSGRLIGSIKTVGVAGKQRAFVGTNVEYGPILEFTYNRPWLEPAKNKKQSLFNGIMKKTVAEQIKKADKI